MPLHYAKIRGGHEGIHKTKYLESRVGTEGRLYQVRGNEGRANEKLGEIRVKQSDTTKKRAPRLRIEKGTLK